jgi:hypothetical protein
MIASAEVEECPTVPRSWWIRNFGSRQFQPKSIRAHYPFFFSADIGWFAVAE